ncbi:hypothetical protein P3T76_004580 [Phytophthora citrophthora]|uniref:Uncharacterized protein n=1 Tax=Phytophthora citrophthora TaxID=4793 RepID=A0AAD9GUV0_9STRA|nr:hypothetical protein P3T76_004580 [Phytophthora citrophthora]
MDLDRRLKQLERIVAQISVARGRTLNGRSLSLYGRDDNSVVAQDDTVQNLIDLTNDIGAEVNTLSLHSESELDSQPFGESSRNHPRSVEITPTDSDINHEVDWETGEADKPSAPRKADLEFEIPPDLAILINGYNEANGQVLTKQREEKMLVLDLDTEDLDNMRMSSQQDQICKVRDIIDKEKSMRDAAVAAIILFNCVEKHKDIGQEIQTVVASEGAFNQDALHEKCAGIATKLEEKDIELARLHKQLKSLSLLPTNSVIGAQEAQELSSKIGMERAAKLSLETERQKIFSRLMKSSLQIQAMVSEELADKFSNAVEKSVPVPVTMTNDRTSD